ncbi:hypothetical protein OESDEN_07994 [Oesophagostomum dentatum]|uniref:Uncharacterized protein n=1 Tax=Oesophagostomum dentatum TaxID=61180 RepID=A0A0B1T9W5_OESDE|nr:hypothetical protein OESDEN_07994 [Oesophagostomum dentatum]
MPTAAAQCLARESPATGNAARSLIRRESSRAIESTREFAQLAQKHITKPKTTSNIAVATFVLIYIAMGVIGVLNIDNCPVRDEIPIWMIVASVVSLVNIANYFYKSMKHILQFHEKAQLSFGDVSGG